jgi:hypothetical protein
MSLLAAELDGQIVVLDAAHARIIVLDERSERIWRACSGRTAEEIALQTGEAAPRLIRPLEELAAAGLIVRTAGRWSQVPVTWV